jgi:hypothetical protein
MVRSVPKSGPKCPQIWSEVSQNLVCSVWFKMSNYRFTSSLFPLSFSPSLCITVKQKQNQKLRGYKCPRDGVISVHGMVQNVQIFWRNVPYHHITFYVKNKQNWKIRGVGGVSQSRKLAWIWRHAALEIIRVLWF